MGSQAIFPSVIGLIWAGVSLGGALIAAPAKFRASSLDMPTVLDIGRAQFVWLGNTEWALLLLLIGALFLSRYDLDWLFYLLPIILFLIQQLGLMPRLDAITLERINGSSASSGYLHIIFIAAEVLKFLALVSISIFTLITLTE